MTEQKYFLKGIANSKFMITRLYEVFSKSIEFTEEDNSHSVLQANIYSITTTASSRVAYISG